MPFSTDLLNQTNQLKPDIVNVKSPKFVFSNNVCLRIYIGVPVLKMTTSEMELPSDTIVLLANVVLTVGAIGPSLNRARVP